MAQGGREGREPEGKDVAAKQEAMPGATSSTAPAQGPGTDEASRKAMEPHLRRACAEGRQEAVKQLLDAGVSPSCANGSGTTPLHEAAFEGFAEVCELLLERGAAVNELDQWGGSALHHAASRGHFQVAELLVSRRADVNGMNYSRQMPLDLAQTNGHQRVADLLEEEAMRLYEARRKRSSRTCLLCGSSAAACGLTLLGALYAAGYAAQDLSWLRESHANGL